jgi:ribose transport system substrate-binding protein
MPARVEYSSTKYNMQKSASAYGRHQAILELVQRYESVRVTDLAEQLNVSESTVRNDLETLDEQGQLVRVRGGAIAKLGGHTDEPAPYLSQRALNHAKEKQAIARWAAGMIEDGDIIILDASSTIFHIAPFLRDRRELTIFTNGIDVARLLAKEPSNTVIVLGGILRSNGNSITGEISKQLLQDYHVQTAFVSCSGFTPDQGFFEVDLREAQMKTLMIQAAQQRVALLDSSKIGRVGLTVYGTLADFNYVVTDENITRPVIEEIRQAGVHVIVCGDQTTRSYAPEGIRRHKCRIGFANLSESTPFSRDVRRSLENAAQKSQQVDLIVADNQLDPQVALQVADELIAQDIDLVIEYQIDEMTGNLIAQKFHQAKIPIIAVDIPMVGGVYFGVNNYVAGKMAGVELGKAIQERWQGELDYLIVVEQQRAGSLPAMRIQGQLDGVLEIVSSIPPEKILRADSDNTVEGNYELLKRVLRNLPVSARIAVVCFNDDAAVGTLHAAQDTDHVDNLLLVGQGADRRLRAEMRTQPTLVIGTTAYRPEDYGEHLIRLALDILAVKQVPPALYQEHFFVSPGNVEYYYPLASENPA